MCSQLEVRTIIAQLRENLANIFPQEQFDVILFGSYARNDADDGSDIDVMFLVDSSRQTIQEKHWQIGEAAAEVLMDFGIVVSPIVENRAYYHANADLLPFFRNVLREGVRMDRRTLWSHPLPPRRPSSIKNLEPSVTTPIPPI